MDFVISQNPEDLSYEQGAIDLRLSKIEELKAGLKLHEQILFELIFEKKLSYRKIAALLKEITKNKDCNYKTIERLSKPIRQKIKEIGNC